MSRVTFLGDALCDPPTLAGHEMPGGGHDFRPVFAPLRDLLAESDLVVANLETPLSPDGRDLTHEKWRFNSPRAYAEALRWAGVGFVTTANNHCLDRGTAGIARVAGSSFTVLVRRKGSAPGRIAVHPAAELWRSLPAGAERDKLAAGIRETAAAFAGRPFDTVEDEYPIGEDSAPG